MCGPTGRVKSSVSEEETVQNKCFLRQYSHFIVALSCLASWILPNYIGSVSNTLYVLVLKAKGSLQEMDFSLLALHSSELRAKF